MKFDSPISSCRRIRQLRLRVVKLLAHIRYSPSNGMVLTQNAHRTSEIHVFPDETDPSSKFIRCRSFVCHRRINALCFGV